MNKDKSMQKPNVLYLSIFVVSIVCCFYSLWCTTLKLWNQILIIFIVIFINLGVQFSILHGFKKYIKYKKSIHNIERD